MVQSERETPSRTKYDVFSFWKSALRPDEREDDDDEDDDEED